LPHPSAILLLGSGPESTRLKRLLARHFLTVESARTLDETPELTRRCRFHRLVLVDPEGPWEKLRLALDACADLPPDIFMIIDRSRADSAVDALRDGIADVLMRPFSPDELVTALTSARSRRSASPGAPASGAPHELVGNSRAMRSALALIERLAPTPATVLVEGETGTGRDLVARLLHELGGRQGPFIHVDCASVAPDELESELFGRASTAVSTGNRPREGALLSAGGGTLYLDEVHELPMRTQGRLQRALEEKAVRPAGSQRDVPVDCRVVASAGPDLAGRVAQRRFRAELFRCLSVVSIGLPPLRRRKADIPLLATHFAERLSAEMGLAPIAFGPAQMEELKKHDWPGNVRELHDLVEQALLPDRPPTEALIKPSARGSGAPDYPLDWSLEQVKQHHMARVVAASDGNKSAAARRLGVSRKTLDRKLGTRGSG
jgi:DNA-binding NtrC family response regulator